MSIQAWLGQTPKSQFVAEYYHKLPYSRAGGGAALCALGSWSALDRLLAGEPPPDVLVVRRGQRHAGPPPRSGQAAQALLEEGCTVLVRHAERHDPQLAELAAGFARDFAAPVNIHVYATPAGEFGFGWHYDAEEVFILQTTGRKEYSLRKNTVHPWPLEETIPQDMAYPREIMPLMRCLLSAGDWLYIPAGYWHKAEAHEAALSLAVGVMAPAAIEAFDLLRPRLLSSLQWRQRLPTLGEASPLSDEERRAIYRQVLRDLAADVQRALTEEEFLDALEQKLRAASSPR